tara:strand:- start:30 stop:968 length:939 start_codon:yes stop_codon:yes gene_type:complete
MKVGIILDGGAGRVIAAIPGIINYIKNNPAYEVYTFCSGWEQLLYGIPEIQPRLYTLEVPHVFKDVVSKCDIVLRPEPYIYPGYFNQELSICEAFNEVLNGKSEESEKLVPFINTTKKEKLYAKDTVASVRNIKGKQKTIVLQPYGRSAEVSPSGSIVDSSGRSLSAENYMSLVQKLSGRYNIIFFGENQFAMQQDTFSHKIALDLRQWAAVIEAADYFVGCDSVGQHLARAVNTKGTVILGSTFANNTTYSDFFNIIEKAGVNRYYSPIRISAGDAMFVDYLNEGVMDFTEQEIVKVCDSIRADLESKKNK